MSSLRLVVEAHRTGLLTKEGADEVLAQRNDLIQKAMRKVAHELVASIRVAGEVKEAGFGDFTNRLLGKGKEVAQKATESPGWKEVGANLGKMLGLAGLTAGATAGVGAIIRHSRDKKVKGQIQSSYHEMFEQEPKLKEMSNDPHQRSVIERNFGILSQFAPSLAAVPSVAGSWVRASVGQGQMSVGEIRNLAETQRRIDDMHEGRHGGPSIAPLRADQVAQTVMGRR